MDTMGLSLKVRIRCTKDDTGMSDAACVVKSQKISAVLGEERTSMRSGERQDVFIRNPPVGLPSFERR